MSARLSHTVKLFRRFGDLSRLRVLDALREGSLTAGEVVRRTRLIQSTPRGISAVSRSAGS